MWFSYSSYLIPDFGLSQMKIPHVLTLLQKSTKFIINIMSLQSFSLYLIDTFYIKGIHLLI